MNAEARLFVQRLILGVVVNVTIFGGLLFLPAGTFNWWRAWVLVGVIFVGTVATMLGVFTNNKELLEERMKPPVQKGQPLADKIIVIPLLASFLGLILFIPLDVFRFQLMVKPPATASFLGLVLFVAGWLLISLIFKENAFAAPVVKHQDERQQTVVDTGDYNIVRHPMYLGAALLMVGMPLWLESSTAAVLASIPIGLLAVRIVFEERFLIRELPGYEAYTKRVRHRLIPFVW